jgi:hypothetical protein
VFTRITIVAATVWILVCVLAAYWAGHRSDRLGGSTATTTNTAVTSTAEEEIDGQDGQTSGETQGQTQDGGEAAQTEGAQTEGAQTEGAQTGSAQPEGAPAGGGATAEAEQPTDQ